MRRWMLAPLLALALAGAARRRHALSSSGAAGATAVGTAIFGAGGLRAAALLVLFFGSSTALSRRGGLASGAAPGPERTLAQVLANGGLPAALAVCAHLRPSPRVGAAYAGALAAANADTWATEVGALSPAAPRMITSGRRVPRGVSGAVTPLGTLASLAGALVIGAGHAALTLHPDPAAALRLGAAGLAGALADSVLGATLQAVYVCQGCGQRTEDRRHAHGTAAPALTLVRGLPLVTNDMVNLCASLVGALTAGLLHHDDTAPRRES
jgi:uncharacterized protein (TIGR00297 family)